MKIEILPSLLAADFGLLAEEILRAAASGADALHLDVMDPNFVPNISFGPDVVALAARTAPGFRRCVHLMMSRPDLYLEKFADAGAQTIQVHVEADCDLHDALARIRSLGLAAAAVINPETPIEHLLPYLGEVDGVLVMTVHPGYGGQKFIAGCAAKVSWLRELRPGLDIMVDGGVNAATAALAAAAGANQFVAGSHLFASADMAAAVAELRRIALRSAPAR
ncbi:MAG: ribulose-phosphate 3-epimerase [Kiritimatiellae bacterium]|nr:ribulose-phosphate 3-epimerase [Kiritimatiellia bacterium]